MKGDLFCNHSDIYHLETTDPSFALFEGLDFARGLLHMTENMIPRHGEMSFTSIH